MTEVGWLGLNGTYNKYRQYCSYKWLNFVRNVYLGNKHSVSHMDTIRQ